MGEAWALPVAFCPLNPCSCSGGVVTGSRCEATGVTAPIPRQGGVEIVFNPDFDLRFDGMKTCSICFVFDLLESNMSQCVDCDL